MCVGMKFLSILFPKPFSLRIVFFSRLEKEYNVVEGSSACCSYHAELSLEVERLGTSKFPYPSELLD